MVTYQEALAGGKGRYYLSLAVFLASLALLLLTVVDMRRAFLFPLPDYFRAGSPSPILYLDPRHVLLLVLGSLGVWFAYRSVATLEVQLKTKAVNLRALAKLLAIAILALLVLDLFIYRGVPAYRIAAAGKIGVGQVIPWSALPGWLQPLGQGIDYLALVWHATVLGILIGALFLTMVASFLKPLLGGKGFKAHVAGAALAIPQPFCSCCAAPIAATLYQGGASLGPTLAFVVSSPLLNPTTLILATVLLPGEFALLRIAGGVLVGIFLTYAVARVASAWVSPRPLELKPNRWLELSAGAIKSYSQLFRFGATSLERPIDSPGVLISTWLALTWKLARVVVPVLFVGSAVTATIVRVLPSPGGDLPGVMAAATLGTLLMVPTWTEIPVAAGLIREGLYGPAAALLLTLPAVSLPCLLIVGGAVRSLRIALLLGFLVLLSGVGVGTLFLYA